MIIKKKKEYGKFENIAELREKLSGQLELGCLFLPSLRPDVGESKVF